MISSKIEILKIIKFTKKILNKAIKLGGSSIKNFSSGSGKKGSFQQHFKVYGRKDQNCRSRKCKGNIIKTGSLGDVMQESIQAALTVVRSRARSLGIKTDFYEKNDIHIHVPEGATPKDGPSAGGAMAIALISVLTNIPVRADTAMTGEITLRGQILKIGGLKEKLLAAKRGGIKNVIIPKENEPDLQEIPKQITSSLNIIPVEWIDEIISIALESEPTPKLNTPKSKTSKKSAKSLQN